MFIILVAWYLCETELVEPSDQELSFGSAEDEGDVTGYTCEVCGKFYMSRSSLLRHLKFECQKEPSYQCLYPNCGYMGKYAVSVRRHMSRIHPEFDVSEFKHNLFS